VSDFEQLRIVVSSDALDDDARAGLARNLRSDLLNVDVEDVRPDVSGPPPTSAKSGEAIAVGALIVSLAPSLVPTVVDIVASWLKRQPSDIEVEVDGQRLTGRVTPRQRDAIVAAYLSRIAPKKSQ
jgi:hypothetical protein